MKHVVFHFKKKFEKSVHLVGFIIRNLSRCTVTWTSDLVINNFYPYWVKGRPYISMVTATANDVRSHTMWFKYDRDYLCVNKPVTVPVIFEPPCVYAVYIYIQ